MDQVSNDFYNKILLPGLLAAMIGLCGSQIYLITSIAEMKAQIQFLSDEQKTIYTTGQASSDWRYQQMIDAEQTKRMDAIEVQVKSQATQIYNIRKGTE